MFSEDWHLINAIFSGASDHRKLPKHAPGSKKYGGYTIYSKGKYSKKSFPELEGLPRALLDSAIEAANNSLTAHTWVCYEVIKKHVRSCQVYTRKRFSFPFTDQMVIVLVSYLLSLGTLKAKTIESYLSDLRVWHLTRGFFVQNLRPDICLETNLTNLETWRKFDMLYFQEKSKIKSTKYHKIKFGTSLKSYGQDEYKILDGEQF